MKNKKGSVGAPRKPIIGLTVNPLAGRFTIAQLVDLNKDSICELTIRKTVEAHVEGVYRTKRGKRNVVTGKATPRLKMLSIVEKQDGVGRPSFVYTILGKGAKATKVTRKAKTVTNAAPETNPTVVVNVAPTPAPEAILIPISTEPTPAPVVETPAPVTVSEPVVTEGSEIPAFAAAQN